MERDVLDDLVETVSFALRKVRLPNPKDRLNHDAELHQAARSIVDQLVLSNWQFRKGRPASTRPPTPPHEPGPWWPVAESDDQPE